MPRARTAAVAFALLALAPRTPLAPPLHAQTAPAGARSPAPAPAAVAALRPLAFLLGNWEGDGWIVLGRSERRTFHQHETARSAAGGTLVVIDGLGTSTDAGRAGEIVHQAFAVISYDSAATALRWRAYRATGEETLATPEVAPGRLVWGMPVGPGGREGAIRFTIELTPEGQWHEVGRFLPPGTAAGAEGVRFLEMTLQRRQ